MNGQDGTTRSTLAGEGKTEVAVLAAGCFGGVEDIWRDVPGVIDTEVGYTGGWLANPPRTAERVIARVQASPRWSRPITTTIEPAST